LISSAGFETMILYLRAASFNCVTGIILLANKNANPLIKMAMTNKGRIKRKSGIPAALIATSSKLSPRFPKVMIEENSKESGRAVGTQKSVTNPTNFNTVSISKPFPTKSSMYNQKNCMVSTNKEMAKAPIKGPMKDLIIRISSFLITCPCLILLHEQRKSKAFIKGTGIDDECRLDFNKECDYTKAVQFFGDTSEQFKLLVQQNPALANEAACAIAPKISKGENYEGLPWVILDFPRYFDKENVFAIRCFFGGVILSVSPYNWG